MNTNGPIVEQWMKADAITAYAKLFETDQRVLVSWCPFTCAARGQPNKVHSYWINAYKKCGNAVDSNCNTKTLADSGHEAKDE